MIFDAVEFLYGLLSANLVADFTTLATAKSVPTLASVNIVKRQDAVTAVSLNAALPLLTIDGAKTTTQAKHQDRRHNICVVTIEFYMRATMSAVVAMGQQTDLLPEAVMMSVDRFIANQSRGVYGGGETPGSVTVEWLRNPYNISLEGKYDRLVTMTLPINQVDLGL